ncbi:hydrophobin 2 [Lyophyllum atratum]|nr:hydrophobin 2 [Lyophyllum atratum]
MSSRMFSFVAFLAFTSLAAATKPTTTVTTTPQPTGTQPASQCGTENLHCCDTIQYSDSSAIAPLLHTLNIVIEGVATPIGITCTPINVLGIGSDGPCAGQPVCCQNNDFHGVVAIACVPINIHL